MTELLVVIAITIMLFAFVTVNLKIRDASALQDAASVVGGMADQARQMALSSRRETTFALVTSGTDAYRAMTVFRINSSGNWQQAGKWVKLPQNIVLDFKDPVSTFFTSGTSAMTNTISLGGTDLAANEYCAQGFRRDGILYKQTEPMTLRLREGFVNASGTDITYTAGTTNRYCDVILTPIGARAKYVRP